MADRKSGTADLAARLVQTLGGQAQLGGDAYPLTLLHLGELTDQALSPEVILATANRKPFTDWAMVARKKDLAAPVVLREDLALLAASPRLLDFALAVVCSPASPTCLLSGLGTKAKLHPALKQPFTEVLQRQVQSNTLPACAGQVIVRNKVHLYLQRLPPPPPLRKPEVELAEKMLQALQARRSQGEEAYPLNLHNLVDQVGAAAAPTLVKKVLAGKNFKERVFLAVPKHPETPLTLAEDRDLLLGSPQLLDFLFQVARTEANQAFSIGDLKKKLLRHLQPLFAEMLDRKAETGILPPGIGWVVLKKNKLLFRLEDVRGARGEEGEARGEGRGMRCEKKEVVFSGSSGFEQTFDEAFERLNRAKGSHNFVSLLDLRREVPVPRAVFDAGLHRLRVADRYTLSAAEGRHGLDAAERKAGLVEEGTLLLYVSRRSS